MAVIIGSARIGENGSITGGAAGDQKQNGKPDYKGEVSMQEFYVHVKGWYVVRPKLVAHADEIAANMIYACNDPTTGYNQNGRLEIVNYGIKSKKKKNSDCSSLVRECVKEATGVDPGNFITDNEVSYLEKTGLFETAVKYTSGMKLYPGDILVTCKRGHTVIVCYSDYMRAKPSGASSKKASVSDTAKAVVKGTYGNGQARIDELKALGYTDAEIKQIQAKVNEMVKATSKPATTTQTTQTTVKKTTSPTAHFEVGNIYTTQVNDLNVRTGPGTDYRKKSKTELTADGRKHADSQGQLEKGTRVTCKDVRTVGSQVWIKTPSGWLCAYNGSKYYVK